MRSLVQYLNTLIYYSILSNKQNYLNYILFSTEINNLIDFYDTRTYHKIVHYLTVVNKSSLSISSDQKKKKNQNLKKSFGNYYTSIYYYYHCSYNTKELYNYYLLIID